MWKCIFIRFELPSLRAVRCLMASKLILSPCAEQACRNIGFSVLGSRLSMVLSLSVIGMMRGRLPFSGLFMLTSFLSRSMSFHVTWVASPILVPVSFRN